MSVANSRAADRRPRAKAPARRAPARRRPSTIDRAAETLPVSSEALRKTGHWVLGTLMGAAVIAGLVVMGVPQMIGLVISEGIGEAGFKVRNVEILNRRNVDSELLYDIASRQNARPMPLVDLDGTRAEIKKLPWIADARVSRRLPDTLVVDIVERIPAAIWQYKHRLVLIDQGGVEIGPVDDRAMPDLPVVVGPGANKHAVELAQLIAAAPSLKPLVTAAIWQGERRWDIVFQSGERLLLPEGREEAAKALTDFSREDRRAGLLGKNIVSIDMRDPSRMVYRLKRDPGEAIVPTAPLGAKSVT
jgi:cell division protein FtsQ